MKDSSDPGQPGTTDADGRFQWMLEPDTDRANRQPPDRARATKPREERTPTGPALVQVLTKVPLFRELASQHVKKFLRLSTPVSVDQGQNVCTMGAPSSELYILLSGKLAVLMEDEMCVALVRPVTTVGEMGFVTKRPRSATLRALEPCSLLSIQVAPLRAMLQADPAVRLRVYRNIIEILSARILSVNSYMKEHLLAKGRQDTRMSVAAELLAEAAGITVDEAMGRIDDGRLAPGPADGAAA
ncbi:cyclic nucleotide-binding domain-containing protein [Candidatus Latescibacterota bacterium]